MSIKDDLYSNNMVKKKKNNCNVDMRKNIGYTIRLLLISIQNIEIFLY